MPLTGGGPMGPKMQTELDSRPPVEPPGWTRIAISIQEFTLLIIKLLLGNNTLFAQVVQ